MGTAAVLVAAGTVGVALGVHCAPMLAALPGVRSRLHPGLFGIGAADHVALTFDDGTDPESTPQLADALTARGVGATFFVRGDRLARHRWLGRLLAGGGHEVAVHGWAPWPLGDHACQGVARAASLVHEVTGAPPRWYRPPYGLLTGSALRACRVVGLTPVLWSVRGLERCVRAESDRVGRGLAAHLRGGVTLAMHCRRSWRESLRALPAVLALCRDRGLRVGPLAEHGLPGEPGPVDEPPLAMRIVHNGASRGRVVTGVEGPQA